MTDSEGLGIEVMPTGRKVWRFRHRNHRVTLGRWPKQSIKAARADRDRWRDLSEWNGLVAARAKERAKRTMPTVRQFAVRYVEEVLKRDRKNPRQLLRVIEREIVPALGARVMAQVIGEDVREIIFRKRDQGKPSAAAALRNLIKRLWDYAIVCDAATVNPAHAVPLKYIGKAKKRARTLSKNEVGIFLRTIDGTLRIGWAQKAAATLVLLTLVRKSELRLATWGEFNFETAEWEIPAEHSKTGQPHIVYLSQQALNLLAKLQSATFRPGHWAPGWFVFPSQDSRTQPQSPSTLNQALKRVKFKMAHFTIHDLRRTAATLLSEEGFAPDVIEKALNHTIKGVRGVYNRAEYSEQRRAMLQAWADMIDKWRSQ